MSAEPLYTLAEAERELLRLECRRFGHDWRVVVQGGHPVSVVCERCGESRRVIEGPRP